MDLKTLSIIQNYEILIRGLVQGVGFRPFICRLAMKYKLNGEVDNRTNCVLINIEGDEKKITDFCNDITKYAPPASRIKSIEKKRKPVNGYKKFSIATSKDAENQITEISPDIAVCADCLDDLDHDRERINYPFINCTNCGPRFTIIEGLPYDRNKTTMKSFEMCRNCSDNYNNILDRRFHAQPIACNSCGPSYTYTDKEKTITAFEQIIKEISSRITAGGSVAVKGLGGYHLMCDALNEKAVENLRKKKHRDSKPFAVMFRDIKAVKKYCFLSKAEEKEITSWQRPVLILREKKKLSNAVNNGLGTTGAMLPYMPFHHILFSGITTPAIVLTSGNISEEPIIIGDNTAFEKLMPVTGAVLTYNREIRNRTDDSVVRIIENKLSLLRRSRGFVPQPVDVNQKVDGILALGAEQKNSFCLGKEMQAIMSQYIGDLKNLPTYDFFKESIERFSMLFRFEPRYIACDLHPDYLSTKHAELLEKQLNIPVFRIQHHHAHIASCMAEYNIDEKVIGISMDGTGYGIDGHIWGGEFLVADLSGFSRFSHFDYIPMPGGDRAVNEPWRMAFSYLYKYFGEEFDYASLPVFKSIGKDRISLIKEMIIHKINTPLTSGAGRLFDAVSAILGLCSVADFDSEAPMRLESVLDSNISGYYPYNINGIVSFADTFRAIIDDLKKNDVSVISAKFHNTIARIILSVTLRMREETSLNKVVLSGGVFQNKYLLERSIHLLTERKFEVFTNHLVPANDGGISLGQLIISSKIKGICA
jgi:hydrogenase maturation protein HypF